MFLFRSLLTSAALLTLAQAFSHSADARDGLYSHHVDSNGNKITEYHGIQEHMNSTDQAHVMMPRRAKFPRPSSAPGYTTCSTAVLDPVDLIDAQSGLASYCGTVVPQKFFGAMSYLSNGVNAYVCGYMGEKPGNNQCDSATAFGFYGLVAAFCGTSASGYHMIEKRGLSYGYDAKGNCFCHC